MLVVGMSTAAYAEGPCVAIHYGRPGVRGEISMGEVLYNRTHYRKHRISGLRPRPDVEGYIAVRNADYWRIGRNYRALVVFTLPGGGLSRPYWLQPIDYQQARHVTSSRCRIETSEALAASMGWSSFRNDRGRTTAYIVQWER